MQLQPQMQLHCCHPNAKNIKRSNYDKSNSIDNSYAEDNISVSESDATDTDKEIPISEEDEEIVWMPPRNWKVECQKKSSTKALCLYMDKGW